MSKRRRRPAGPPPGPRPSGLGERLVLYGVTVGLIGVPLAVLPIGANPFGPPKALALSVATALVAAGLAISPELLAAPWRRLRASRGAWALAALLLLGALSTCTSVAPRASLLGTYPSYQGYLATIAYALVTLGAMAIYGRPGAESRLGRMMTVALIVVCAYGAAQAFGADPLKMAKLDPFDRVSSTLGNSSNLAVWLAIAIPLVFERARRDAARWWRVAAWIGFGMSLPVMLWTSSRGGWLAILVAAAVWLMFEASSWETGRRRLVLGAAAGAVTAMVIVGALVSPRIASRIVTSLNSEGGTVGWRLSAWRSSLRMTADNPVLGHGPNSFRWVFPPYREKGQYDGSAGPQIAEDAHNVFVNTAATLGVPAVIALGAAVVLAFAGFWSRRPRAPGTDLGSVALAASLAGAIGGLQFHYVTMDTGVLFWLLLVLGVTRTAPEPQRARSEPAAGRARHIATAALAAAALPFVVATLTTAGLVLADMRVTTGNRLLAAGGVWDAAASEYRAAESLAPWEPAMARARGRAAMRVLRTRDARRAVADGLAAYDVVIRSEPQDWSAKAEKADLLVAAGMVTRDKRRIAEALRLARWLAAFDPNNGIPYVTLGDALQASGRMDEAISAYRAACRLAPNWYTAWDTLEAAYKTIGEDEKSKAADDHLLR